MATARGSNLSRSLDLSPLRRSSPLPTNILPSKGDVIRFAKHLQIEAGRDKTDENGRKVKGLNYRQYPIALRFCKDRPSLGSVVQPLSAVGFQVPHSVHESTTAEAVNIKVRVYMLGRLI